MRKLLFSALALLLLLALCAGCAQAGETDVHASDEETGAPASDENILTGDDDLGEIAKDAQLLALAGSREEAEALAEQYGVTLVEYANGVASFYTEGDPGELIELGLANGWPELSLNRVYHAK